MECKWDIWINRTKLVHIEPGNQEGRHEISKAKQVIDRNMVCKYSRVQIIYIRWEYLIR